jgi:hypothetical protein
MAFGFHGKKWINVSPDALCNAARSC